ncbi:Gfo/Idh/MocA family protein [Kiritimatiella glycovorans]|uniref:Oxidoreductase domain protein n=1 Tax=Kiritimatiella glycovorans TaxID=1307763 RepID=A0A0G3EJU0_9BACT|nr:Gfo/Idh/MocA family oxidoreductase [Kiritimatiella glycovorans]AKJ64394.1 Oxidoreductase domain protein [Kiritimatiella glycovorans]
MKTGSVNRRGFVRAGAAVIGAPAIIPAYVLGAEAPSNDIVIAAIGQGGMGRGNTANLMRRRDCRVVAVCDVDPRRRAAGKTMVDNYYGNKDCLATEDYLEIVAREDIDAVMIALPDHWHARAAIDVLRSGKDVYGEKPVARTIREGRAICDAVERYGRIWQTGSWQRSQRNFLIGAEMVHNGVLGEIQRVEVGIPGGVHDSPLVPVTPPPEGFNYERWLGPAPWRPHRALGREGRTMHWNWRWIRDYGAGYLSDWCPHHLDIAHWGMGYDRTGPVKITEARGIFPERGLFNTPGQFYFKAHYADGHIIEVGCPPGMNMGTKWIGERGSIRVNRGGLLEIDPPELRHEYGRGNWKALTRSVNHHENFVRCIRSRRTTVAPAEVGHRTASVALLCEISLLLGRDVHWDPERESILNDPTANAMLGRTYREPWSL